jgi:hypothetical protein
MQPHRYGHPPPGQASPRDAVCTVCGARRSVASDTECPGRSSAAVAETLYDYEPLSDEALGGKFDQDDPDQP